MAESLGTAVLTLTTDPRQLIAGLSSSERITQLKSSSMAKTVLGIGTAFVAIGAVAFKMGKDFDAAYDTIRVGTGATGRELEGLKEDFRGVVTEVPATFGDASKAVADLNRRLGLSGQPLRNMAAQVLELSRITGTDLDTNIRTVARAFQDWEVSTKDQSATLDGFFRLSQETGISVDALASQVVQFGAPLRNFGFSIQEAAAMFAGFEQAGVNMTTTMAGMRLGVGNLADPTTELTERLKGLGLATAEPQEQFLGIIEAMGRAKTRQEALGIAIDVFGRRAANDMAEAVEQGRFKVDDLIRTMTHGKDTIRAAGRDTMDFAEQWQLFKNRVLVKLEPIAIRVFAVIGTGMAVLANNTEILIPLVSAFAAGWLAYMVATKSAAVGQRILNSAMLANPVFRIIFLITLLVTALSALGVDLGDLKKIWAKGWDAIKDAVSKAWKAIKGALTAVWNFIKGMAEKVFKVVRKMAEFGLLGPIPLIIARWKQVKQILNTIWNAIKSAAQAIFTRIRDIAISIWTRIRDVIGGAARRAKEIAVGVFQALRDAAASIFERIGDVVRKAKDIIVEAFNKVKGAVQKIIGWFRDLFGVIKDIVGVAGDVAGVIGKIGDVAGKLNPFGGPSGGPGALGFGKVSGVDQFTPIAGSFGLSMTSGYRPGDPGYHGLNRARDYSNSFGPTPQMMAFARFMVANYGSVLRELIYSPLGFGIKDGRVVPNSFWGAGTVAGHYNHVHVAFKHGGIAPGGLALVGEAGPELAMLPRGTRVFSNDDSRGMLEPSTLVADIYIGGERIDERVDVRLRKRERSSKLAYRAGLAR